MSKLAEIFKAAPPRLIKVKKKEAALREMAQYLCELHSGLIDYESFVAEILEREALCTTGIGLGLAIPHARLNSASQLLFASGWSKKGIPFDAVDQKPVHLIVMFAVPDALKGEYLKTVSEMIKEVRSELVQRIMHHASTIEEITGIFVRL